MDSGISVRELSVRVAGRALLEKANAEFPKGGVTLVIGASGAGKSVLMKLLAGLIRSSTPEFRIGGSVRVDGRETLGSTRPRHEVGIVFQNFALFDELSAAQNIQFALDHRRSAPGSNLRPELSPDRLLEEFRIPKGTPVRALSGGQQQRLAVARTLAYDPPVLVYDEPTSGLDPENARRVAGRIRETCQKYGKTTVVVTHDYAHLAEIADRIYVLDSDTRQLTEMPADSLESLEDHVPGADAFDQGDTTRRPGILRRAARGVGDFFAGTGALVDRTLLTLFALLPLWRSPKWGLRYLAHYLGIVASVSSWIYFLAAGVIAGFVATYFSYEFLPHRGYTEPLIGDEVLNALGFALYRIVVPVLATILLAARCGAAIASDVGNRSYLHQVEAMKSFGIRPYRYLLTNILWSLLIGTPVVVGISFLAARMTSLVVFLFNNPGREQFWTRHFHRDLIVPSEIPWEGTLWVLAKVLLCGLGVGAIAYFRGIRPKRSGVEVSAAITGTVIWATLWVLCVHFGCAFLEFPAPAEPNVAGP